MSVTESLSRLGLIAGLGLVGYVGITAVNAGVTSTGPDENIMTIATENELMQQAEKDAVATLPRFLELAATEPASWSPITLKVGMQGSDMIENIWVDNIKTAGPSSFSGTLANNPMQLAGLTMGSRVIFEENQITDWAVQVDGRGYGYYSVRAIAELVSEEEGAQLRAFLASDPLPPSF